MLVKNPRFERGSKLEPWWETTSYWIEKQPFLLLPAYDMLSEGPEINR